MLATFTEAIPFLVIAVLAGGAAVAIIVGPLHVPSRAWRAWRNRGRN